VIKHLKVLQDLGAVSRGPKAGPGLGLCEDGLRKPWKSCIRVVCRDRTGGQGPP
jgi:hypothetical protein